MVSFKAIGRGFTRDPARPRPSRIDCEERPPSDVPLAQGGCMQMADSEAGEKAIVGMVAWNEGFESAKEAGREARLPFIP